MNSTSESQKTRVSNKQPTGDALSPYAGARGRRIGESSIQNAGTGVALDGFNAGLGECLSSPFVIETAATCLDGVESFVGGVDENCHAGKQLLVIQRGRGK